MTGPIGARAVLMLSCAMLAGTAFATETPREPVEFQWGVKVPMRDGVRLNATLYKARAQAGPLPCVFTLTPYISQSYHDRGMYFAANGYVFLTVDVRGRGNSEGSFTPLLQEAKDGHDVVEWLARQPYCSDKVTMWGGSYAGYNQWATAKEFPPHLATIVPVASPKPGTDFPMQHNMFYPYDLQWLTLVGGRASQDAIFGDSAFWSAQLRRWYEARLPFNQLDRHIGMPSPVFQEWISHPARDAYWDSYSPTPRQMSRIDLPILSVTGHYDGDQPGALAYYDDHMRNASEAAKARHYLIIGPWDHAGTRTPKAEVGGLRFDKAALLDMNALHKAWYDWTMKDGAKPAFLKDRVAYYVTVEEAWRYAPTLEAVTRARESWFLDSVASRANDVFAGGELRRNHAGSGEPDRYVHDPLDIRSAEWESEDNDAGLVDQRSAMRAAGKSLFYHTPPFAEDTDIAGRFSLSAWLSIDQPDTDISVVVHEVLADGSIVYLASDAIRARYREDPRKAELAEPGAIERYDFDDFAFNARRIRKGSRLRLMIGPVNSMYAEKNWNAGGVVSAESGKDARTVTVTLYHDAQRPSALSVPIAAPSSVASQ